MVTFSKMPEECTRMDDDPSDVGSYFEDEEVTASSSKQQRKDDQALLVSDTMAKENTAVWGFRLLTAAVLVGVAITVCSIVALNEKKNERKAFETAFRDLGGQLITTFQSHLLQRMGVVQKFAMELTTEAKSQSSNTTWPFFTPTDYEQRAAATAELAELTQIFILPRVETHQKEEWEDYAQTNKGWIEDGLIARGHPEPIQVGQFPPKIYYLGNETGGMPVPMNSTGPYFPMWIQYPAAEQTFTNFNPYGNGEAGKSQIDAVLDTHMPSFPRSLEYMHLSEEERKTHFVYQRIKLTRPDYEGDPLYTGYYPVYNRLDSHALDQDNKEEKQVVALLMGGVIWKTYFESILPEGTKPMLVILENECNQVYTYQVGGNYSQFLDFGDLHNPKYDPLELGTNVNEVIGMDPDKFTLSLGNCDYSIRIYPSEEFENSYYSSRPVHFALALAGVFVFTCLVFLIYDYWVEKRQQSVMKSALQSGKLVSSLFPEEVRDRLYQEEEERRNAGKPNWKREKVPTATSHAIATLYPETTIFFADLVGFTSWSSTRTPVEVFDLLETIYGAFDKLAKRYNVFKVETIGDCYVAVTGLPHPQKNHAILMCKFAQACMSRLHVVTAGLVESLGEDTATLEMRVGLHSGPVTAGVLRGEKSRFQLFGDSVNTASRMESNGMKGRIHCSKATALALRNGGKSTWLTPREDRIIAKGKGEMNTFWVEVSGTAATSVVSSRRSSSANSDVVMPPRTMVAKEEDEDGIFDEVVEV